MRKAAFLSVPLCIAVLAPESLGQKVYWMQFDPSPLGRNILRANLDGSDLEVVVPVSVFDEISSFALDIERGHIYYPSHGTDAIQRADLDGSNAGPFVTSGVDRASRLALDEGSGSIFWTQTPVLKKFGDGFEEPEYVVFGEEFKDVLVNSASGSIIWAEYHNETSWCEDLGVAPCYCVHTSGLDGSDARSVFCEAGINCFRDIDVHASGGRLYWLNPGAYQIRSANLDGSDARTVLGVQQNVNNFTLSLAIDPVREKLHWFGLVPDGWLWFHESDLDGANPRAVFQVPRPGQQGAMAIDPRSPGDRDLSGTVDLIDHAAFQNCFGRDRSEAWSSCSFFDVDPADGNVDEADSAAFIGRWHAP